MKALVVIVMDTSGILSIGLLNDLGDALGVLLLLWTHNIERH